MDPDPQAAALPPGLRALQRLVTVLTVVMIAGFLVLIGAFVMRLNAGAPVAPDTLEVPEGAEPLAFTQGSDWVAVVVRGPDGAESIRVHDRLTGRLRQEIVLAP